MRIDDRITVEQGYRAMLLFLDEYFQLTRADEIGALLGGLSLTEDGKSMDPAMWDEWVSAVDRASSPSPSLDE